MNLKKRLVYSNTAIVLIPFIITIAVSFCYIFIFNTKESLENVKNVSKINYEFSKVTQTSINELSKNLSEQEIGEYLTTLLSIISAEVVIQKENEIIYSTKSINKIDLQKCVENRENKFSNSIEIDSMKYILKVLEINYKDGKQGNIILLAPIQRQDIGLIVLLTTVILTYIISFGIVNLIFINMLSNSILTPVKKLDFALGEISNGNLDCEVVESGDKEIQELCRAFEIMRLKLKESIYTQIKYDDNRKMLISSISHDLKTPITSIKGYVEGIIDGVADTPEKIDKYLKTIHIKAYEVDNLIEQLLLYSKLDLNQIPFNFEKTDVLKYFEDCIMENQPELERLNVIITLENNLSQNISVLLDRDKFKRVINNIINNSSKYINNNSGQIIIILRETRTSMIIEIKDNGLGISSQDLPFIFDKFYRSDIVGYKEGSGLGLAIAKQIVEGHKGKIWAKSEINKGTSIIISLKR